MTQLFTVTLTDLGTYQVTVAAKNANHAMAVAKLLLQETDSLPPGITSIKREVDGTADVAASQPIRQFDVTGTYSMEFFIRVPAVNAEEAERHARRIYAEEPQPFEYATGDERVTWRCAREVVS